MQGQEEEIKFNPVISQIVKNDTRAGGNSTTSSRWSSSEKRSPVKCQTINIKTSSHCKETVKGTESPGAELNNWWQIPQKSPLEADKRCNLCKRTGEKKNSVGIIKETGNNKRGSGYGLFDQLVFRIMG